MTQNRITRLKNKLIEDITVIEQNKFVKQNNLNNKIYIESPYDRKMLELAEQIKRQQMRDWVELQKKLVEDQERIMREMLESIKKKKDEVS